MSIKNNLRIVALAIPAALVGIGSAFSATSPITVDAHLASGKLIDATRFTWGVSSIPGGSGLPTRTIDDIQWGQAVDVSLSTLWDRLLTNSHAVNPTRIDFMQPGTSNTKPYLSISAEDPRVRGIDLNSDTASVSEDFSAIALTYDPAGLGRSGSKTTLRYTLQGGLTASPASATVSAFTETQPAAFSDSDISIYIRLGHPASFIPGDSQAAGYENWIRADSMNVAGEGSAASDIGGARGFSTISALTWTQSLDRSVPHVLSDVLTGEHVSYATLEFVKDAGAGPVTFMQITLDDVLFTDFDIKAGTESLPQTMVSVSFAAFQETVWNINANGTRGDSHTVAFSLIEGKSMAAFVAPDIPNFGKGNLAPVAPVGFTAMALSVPEPGTWFLTLVGLSMLGVTGRAMSSRTTRSA